MQVHFLFVLRKLLAWLFAFLSTLLPQHLLVQVPENERCLVPQEAPLGEVPPSLQTPGEALAAETVTTAPPPKR